MDIDPLGALSAPFVLMEDRLTPGAPARLYINPVKVVRCDDIGCVDAALSEIEEAVASGLHAAGLLAYELGYALEPKLAHLIPGARDAPLLEIGLFRPPRLIASEVIDAAFARLPPPPPLCGLRSEHDTTLHASKVEHILRLIEAGDVYQVNLTYPIRFQYTGEALSLYAALRVHQPVAHGGVAVLGDMAVLSVSPELWIEIAADRATTRPMKGTTARGADRDTDRAARDILAHDPKQRAENLMILDLLRNDLSRISMPGTVVVPDHFTVETYPTFHALTSTITGQLRPGLSLRDRIAALFPCGSVVGAPKIRAGQIIRDLEPSPRGFYTGGLGTIAPNGDMVFNVCIRTAMLNADGTGQFGVGGGIVADSDPKDEYDETRLKGRVLIDLAEDYDLFETFRFSPKAGFVRRDLHLDRLSRSAKQLAFAFERRDAEQMLDELAQHLVAQFEDQRIRLRLTREGRLSIRHEALVAPVARLLRVHLAGERVDPADPFLRHKTTRRRLYDTAFAAAVGRGFDEVLFLNRRGEVAETSRNSVFVRAGDRFLTPPLSSGVLPGVLRGQLLATGQAIEHLLSPADLQEPGCLSIGNSLHGLREAVLERQ